MKYIRYNNGITIKGMRLEVFIFAEIDGDTIERSITRIHYKNEVIMMEILLNDDEYFSLLNQLIEYHKINLNDKSHSIDISKDDFESKYNQKLDEIKRLNPDNYTQFSKSYFADTYPDPSMTYIFMKMREDLGDKDLYEYKGLQMSNEGLINITYPEYDEVIKVLNDLKTFDPIMASGSFLHDDTCTDYHVEDIDRNEFKELFDEFIGLY